MRKSNSAFVITVALIASMLTFAAAKLIGTRKTTPPQTRVATVVQANKKLSAFSLVDTNGTEFGEHSLQGRWTLLFFGYPKCPDICPATLGIVRDSWNILSKRKPNSTLRFVFADISSQQIATSQLQQFMQNYHPQFIGVQGAKEEMQKLGDQLGIYAKQQGDSIDHTAALMLIDPQGYLHAIFTPPFTADDIVHDLSILQAIM